MRDDDDDVEIAKNERLNRASPVSRGSPSNRIKHLKKKNDDSFSSSSMTSLKGVKKRSSSTNNARADDLNSNNVNNNNNNRDAKKEFGKIQSGLNDARLGLKSSSNTTDSNSNNNNLNSKLNSNSNINSNLNGNSSKKMSQNSTNIDPTLERPPGRLNNYDSDTNTISEGFIQASNLKRSNHHDVLNRRLHKGWLN